MADDPLSILVIGAHPDDPEYYAGGVTAMWVAAGFTVRYVTLTNGDAGHRTMRGQELALRRRAEAAAAGAVLGVEYRTLDNSDGTLLPTLEVRNQVIAEIRRAKADLVLTHRPYDYHADHRYTGQAVQDGAFLAIVGNLVPEFPPLPQPPLVMFMWDGFQKPYPFRPDVVVDVDALMDKKLSALDCHVSQLYEWLDDGEPMRIPKEREARLAWMADKIAFELLPQAESYRRQLIEAYGEEHGRAVRYAEAFEHCEYGAPLTTAARRRFFPFLY
ncbi:MAG: PIG-L deacetylase family protein [Anaerolineae bacterium]